jgi:hypothetical protein
MALDYTDTGHFYVFGHMLSISESARRLWNYCRKINSSWPGSGNPYFKSVINTVLVNTSQPPDEAETDLKSILKDETEEAYKNVHNGWKASALQATMLTYLGQAMDLDEGTIAEGAVVYEYNEDLRGETGQTTVTRRGGVLGTLARFMELAGESIRTNGVVLGAIAAQAGNRGVLTESTVGGGRSHSLPGVLTMHVVDETIGRTQLTLENKLTDALPNENGELTRVADNTIFVTGSGAAGVDYEDGPTGVTLQLRYGPFVESGDAGNIISSFAWTDPSGEDSDFGVIYMRITRVSQADAVNGIFQIELFRGANFDLEENLIGTRPILVDTGTVDVSIPGRVANFTFTFNATNADTALPNDDDEDADIEFDQQVPRLGDVFTKAVSNDKAGVIATKIAEEWPVSLNVATNPSQTIPDTLAPTFVLAA